MHALAASAHGAADWARGRSLRHARAAARPFQAPHGGMSTPAYA